MENLQPTEIQNKSIRSRAYAVCSGSKAIGKTWLATSICHTLGLMKKKVLFFDADCGVDNVSGQLGLEIRTAYGRLLNGSKTLNNCVARFDKGKFDILCSVPGEDCLNGAPPGRIQLMAGDLVHLSENYDYVFVDCANEYRKAVNPFLNICANLILLVNADPAAITAAYHQLEVLKKIDLKAKIHVVVNRAISVEEGAQTYKTLLKAAKEYIKVDLNLLGIIRKDSHIREAVVNQALLLTRYPACEGAEDVKNIVRRIVQGE